MTEPITVDDFNNLPKEQQDKLIEAGKQMEKETKQTDLPIPIGFARLWSNIIIGPIQHVIALGTGGDKTVYYGVRLNGVVIEEPLRESEVLMDTLNSTSYFESNSKRVYSIGFHPALHQAMVLHHKAGYPTSFRNFGFTKPEEGNEEGS